MTPLQMSAQCAAYLWFKNQPENADAPQDDAHQFARLNWERFLECADEGFGRLLLRMTKPRRVRNRTIVTPSATVAA